jgi:Protein of unknown function (DUF2985)
MLGSSLVFWGAAIVLFLLHWIPTSSKDQQGFWVEVSSQIENGVFHDPSVVKMPLMVTSSLYCNGSWITAVESCRHLSCVLVDISLIALDLIICKVYYVYGS